MSTSQHMGDTDHQVFGGCSVVDRKGRFTLPGIVRRALGLVAGSPVAYVVLDGVLLLIPQDAHLATSMRDASRALARMGVSAQDVIAELPTARAEIMSETYSAAFLLELERMHAALRGATSD